MFSELATSEVSFGPGIARANSTLLDDPEIKERVIEEQAEATEELIANLTEAHTRQAESLIKTNTEAMKEISNFQAKNTFFITYNNIILGEIFVLNQKGS